MTPGGLTTLLQALLSADVRFLVAGGIAVVAYGYVRGTDDCDLIVALDDPNAGRAIDVLLNLGYVPRIPVDARDFAKTSIREGWIRDKHMLAFHMRPAGVDLPGVDLFVRIPFDFEQEMAKAPEFELGGGVGVRVVSLDTLLKMKDDAGRDKDKADARMLRTIHGREGGLDVET